MISLYQSFNKYQREQEQEQGQELGQEQEQKQKQEQKQGQEQKIWRKMISLGRSFTLLIIAISLVLGQNALSQNYLWPTDASHALTSSFAEYRPGRFHAGIDIKTWGQVGYKIFAIGPGHISRLRVSPFGYGRAVYLSLDTGESVVFAHMLKFNDDLEAYVQAEQERRGRFSVDLYLNEQQFRVQQGDLLGYTGQSGVGYPHLHFELRDHQNRPINPFLRGYEVKDTVAPTITKISITPMDAASTVEGDWRPVILTPVRTGDGHYSISQPVLVYGRIAFGVSAFDKMDGVDNNYGTYRNSLLVDGETVYSAAYDRFPYDENNQANLDRDFRLFMHGKGIFYKLYRDYGNTLSFAAKPDLYYGVIDFSASPAKPSLLQEALSYFGAQEPLPKGVIHLDEGYHDFQIAVEDFWGNRSTVAGRILARRKEQLSLRVAGSIGNGTLIGEAQGQNGIPLSKCSLAVSLNYGQSWLPISNLSNKLPVDSNASQGRGNSNSFIFPLSKMNYAKAPFFLRAQAQDSNGIPSFPAFALVNGNNGAAEVEQAYQVESEYYDNYIRLEISAPRGLLVPPQVTGWHEDGVAERVRIIPSSPGRFYGSWPLSSKESGPIPLEIIAGSDSGGKVIQKEWLRFTAVAMNKNKRVRTEDDLCYVDFSAHTLFRDMFVRTRVVQPESSAQYDLVSKVYEIEPMDVPLRSNATISIKYPAGDTLANRIGLFYRNGKNGWAFLGNSLSVANGTISGRASSFGAYALIRDTDLPTIDLLYPSQGAHLTTVVPTLRAHFHDRLSGIGGDEDMEMLLDGHKVIAEYDPEQNSLFYNVRKPLAKGRHRVDFHVRDRCGNKASRSNTFWID